MTLFRKQRLQPFLETQLLVLFIGIVGYRSIETISIFSYDRPLTVGKKHAIGTLLADSSNANYDNDLSTSQFETDSLRKGMLEITSLDRNKMLVQGTFSFAAYHPVTHKTVNITEGTFSINYRIH